MHICIYLLYQYKVELVTQKAVAVGKTSQHKTSGTSPLRLV
jgi:hypothetical protein